MRQIELWCNGNTPDFGSGVSGSSPDSSAKIDNYMKKILSVRKGKTHCDWCPFAEIIMCGPKATVNVEHCRKYVKTTIGIDCTEYDLSTLKAIDMPSK